MKYENDLLLDIENEMREFNNDIDYQIEYTHEENEITNLKNNKIDIPFFLAVLIQNINKVKNKEIIEEYLKFSEENNTNIIIENDFYKNNEIKIFINLFDKDIDEDFEIEYQTLNKTYLIELSVREEATGYCECKPEDKDYDLRYKCCGHGCDWHRPCLNISLIVPVDFSIFEGDEHDIWDVEDEYNDIDEETKQINGIENELNYLNQYLDEINIKKKKLLENLSSLKKDK